MKKVSLFNLLFLLFACGNEIEEITDPQTGVVLIRYEYYKDKSGQKIKDGLYSEWNKDGSPRNEIEYKDGLKHGKQTYTPSKDTVVHNEYIHGKMTGLSTLIVHGEILKELTYRNDQLQGCQKFYYPGGKLKAEGDMKSSIPVKEWTYYSPTHKYKSKLKFDQNGVCLDLIGKWNHQRNNKKKEFILLDEKGKFEYHAPMFKFDTKPVMQLHGNVYYGQQMNLVSNRKQITYDIRYCTGDTLSLYSPKAKEEFIFVRRKE